MSDLDPSSANREFPSQSDVERALVSSAPSPLEGEGWGGGYSQDHGYADRPSSRIATRSDLPLTQGDEWLSPDSSTGAKSTFALLLAAHGERRAGAGNAGVAGLAARLAAADVAGEVGVGFLKGEPSIGDAVRRLAAHDLLVYPLFLSDGYFTRTLLPRRLEQACALAGDRAVHIFPPLGLDPALIGLILDRAQAVARAHGWVPAHANLVLLAHGSSNNPASRRAAERIGAKIAALGVFARVRPAFLEEPPYLDQTVTHAPAVVVGLFAGEGLHGGGDAPQLVAELARADLAFAGNVGGFEALPAVIAGAIRRGERARATSARPGLGEAAYVCR